MVASLQFKKEALEAKLRDKTNELKKLCIEEAELTGVLPAETPLEPGESPPQIRRRVGTAFTYPESLINKIRSKEDEALAALELECKIQTGIAEAALGLANDGTASKSVRRKHRVLYQESQRRLSELENRLTILKQAQPKHKKKPRPQTDLGGSTPEGDYEGESEEVSEHTRHPMLGVSLSDRGMSPSMKHSNTYSGLPRHLESQLHCHNSRLVQSHVPLPNIDYRHSVQIGPEVSLGRSCNPHYDRNGVWWWGKGRETWYNHSGPYPQTEHPVIDSSSSYVDRFGSLDRNAQCLQNVEYEHRISATLPRSSYVQQAPPPTVLLPSQTYPENSLMRTQSLGNMDSSKQLSDRKSKEKEWYESCLDSAPPRPPTTKPKTPIEFGQEALHNNVQYESPPIKTQQASVNNVMFDTVVPYESPKNHTVVQAGKWQPYREVSKPFEMSDFYKYSTKFRKGQGVNTRPPASNEPPSPQQKGLYRPLQPLECQPLTGTTPESDDSSSKGVTPGNSSCPLTDAFASEMLSWYHDKNSNENMRSSTLV